MLSSLTTIQVQKNEILEFIDRIININLARFTLQSLDIELSD